MPAAGTPLPNTADFAVTTDSVRNAAIAKLAGVGAGYVVVSEGIGSLGAPAGIFATVYDGNGNAGPQIQINNPATPDILGINQPSVAALSGGGFVVTWHSPRDSSFYIEDVWARVFTAGGAPVADQFKVSPLTSVPTEQRQVYPTVIGGADNGFTVAWWEQPSGSPGPGRNSFDVLSRSFDGAGVATGDPAVLAMPVTGWQMHPSAAAFADGVPAFAWARGLADPSPGIGYAWAGVDGGIPDTQASSSGFSSPPAIAVLSDDRVAIVWARDVGGSQGLDISAQVLNRNGTVSVATFSVVTDAGAQSQPDILELNDGGFLISWLSGGVLVAQRYASSGAALGDRFQVAQ
jgi:hypothetical protein